MAAPKGNKFSKGRPKGCPNKVTASIKAMIEGALDRLGGEDWLVEKAQEDPKAFFGLIGKTLPLQVNQQVDANVNHSGAVNVIAEIMQEIDGGTARVGQGDSETLSG